jgi:hypothetical protein
MGDHRPCGTRAGDLERGRLARYFLIVLGLLGFVLIPGTGSAAAGTPTGLRSGAAQPPLAQATAARSRAAAARVRCTAVQPAVTQAEAGQVAGLDTPPAVVPTAARAQARSAPCDGTERRPVTPAGVPVLPVGERGPPHFTG